MEQDVDEPEELEGKECHGCEEEIDLTDPAVQIIAHMAFLQAGTPTKFVSYEEDGSFKYTPLHLHADCWESLIENVRELAADALPATSKYRVLVCEVCGSDIEEGEDFSEVTLGELHRSERSPRGIPELAFFSYEKSQTICFQCMSVFDQLVEARSEGEDEDDEEEDS